MAEKEEQLTQLAKDRAELRSKMASLQQMITQLVARQPSEPVEVGEEATPMTVSETMKAEADTMAEREKILELIADIGTGSESMIAACDKFDPWFWDSSPHKVMTV